MTTSTTTTPPTSASGAETQAKRELTLDALCEIIPPCTDTEFTELKEDMKHNGLRVPIKLFRGKILDGRSRYKAYAELWDEGFHIELKTETFSGSSDEAIAYVISMNVKRRHLKASQRAVIAATLVTSKLGGDRSVKLPTEITQEDVARLAGVATKMVTDAKAVLNSGDAKLAEQVRKGEIPVNKAAKKVRETAKQAESGKGGDDAQGDAEGQDDSEQKVVALVASCTKRVELLVGALNELRTASTFLVAKQNAEQAKNRLDEAISQMRKADREEKEEKQPKAA